MFQPSLAKVLAVASAVLVALAACTSPSPTPPATLTATPSPTPTPTPTFPPALLPRVVTFHVEGTVHDLEKGPNSGIPGAVVMGTFGLESTSRRVKADSSGHYDLSGYGHSTDGSLMRLIVVAEGYFPLRLTCDKNCNVGLTPFTTTPPHTPWEVTQVSVERGDLTVSVHVPGNPQGMSFLLVSASSFFVPESRVTVGATRTETTYFKKVSPGEYTLLVQDGIGNISAQTVVVE